MSTKRSYRISRREFVKGFTVLASGLMGMIVGLPAIGYLLSPALKRSAGGEEWIPAGPLKRYPPGEPALFSFTRSKVNGWERTSLSYGVYILRKEGGEVIAFSNICTHLACRVTWRPELQEYVSPCHDGHFARTGEVTKGPPPRPLDRHKVKVEDCNLWISVEKFRWQEVRA